MNSRKYIIGTIFAVLAAWFFHSLETNLLLSFYTNSDRSTVSAVSFSEVTIMIICTSIILYNIRKSNKKDTPEGNNGDAENK